MKNINIKHITTFMVAACLSSFIAFKAVAQPGNSKLKVYSEKSTGKVIDNSYPTLIKINPLQWLIGEMPVYIERRLVGPLTFEAGLGPTFYSFMSGTTAQITPYNNLPIESALESRNQNTLYSTNLGLTAKGGLRVYFGGADAVPEGTYLAMEARLRFSNYSFHDPSTPNMPTLKITDRHFDIVGVFGRQYEISDRLYTESYTGIGLRMSDAEEIVVKVGTNDLVYTTGHLKGMAPIYSFGIKIGYLITE